MREEREFEHDRHQPGPLVDYVLPENFQADGKESYLMLPLDPPISIHIEIGLDEIHERHLEAVRSVVACLHTLDNELQDLFLREWRDTRRDPFELENRLERIQVTLDKATFHYSGRRFLYGDLMSVVWEEEFHRTEHGRWVQLAHRPLY